MRSKKTQASICVLCHQLSHNNEEVTVTYHKCMDCKVEDYEVVKKNEPQRPAVLGFDLPFAATLLPPRPQRILQALPSLTSDPTRPPTELAL